MTDWTRFEHEHAVQSTRPASGGPPSSGPPNPLSSTWHIDTFGWAKLVWEKAVIGKGEEVALTLFDTAVLTLCVSATISRLRSILVRCRFNSSWNETPNRRNLGQTHVYNNHVEECVIWGEESRSIRSLGTTRDSFGTETKDVQIADPTRAAIKQKTSTKKPLE